MKVHSMVNFNKSRLKNSLLHNGFNLCLSYISATMELIVSFIGNQRLNVIRQAFSIGF